jgi:cytochrome c oxidase subunit 3
LWPGSGPFLIHASIFPDDIFQVTRTELFQGVWPPKGIEVLSPWKLPLLNTLLLLTSGATLTWAHHGLLRDDRGVLIKGLIATDWSWPYLHLCARL